jgi:hypothetical protein
MILFERLQLLPPNMILFERLQLLPPNMILMNASNFFPQSPNMFIMFRPLRGPPLCLLPTAAARVRHHGHQGEHPSDLPAPDRVLRVSQLLTFVNKIPKNPPQVNLGPAGEGDAGVHTQELPLPNSAHNPVGPGGELFNAKH